MDWAPVADAVVVGAGHNGLVAANLLADAGWEVLVLEATGQPGGSVRTAELTAPGFHCDVFSAFFALGAASPILGRLELERYGLEWVHAPLVVAHPHTDGRCAVLSRDLAETAASLEAFAPGDGAAWERLFRTSVWIFTRPYPQSSKQCASRSSFASGFTCVPHQRLP